MWELRSEDLIAVPCSLGPGSKRCFKTENLVCVLKLWVEGLSRFDFGFCCQGAAKVLIFPVVQQFTEAFVQALQMPDGPTSDSGFKMEVLKVKIYYQ